MAITVARSLSIYPADLSSDYSSFDLPGLVVLRIRSRYQLLVQSDPGNAGLQIPLDNIFTPEFCTSFVIPRDFLLEQETTESYVENQLLELGLDDNACKFLSPKIAEFAIELAERMDTGEMEQGYAAVAEVYIDKADFVSKEELSRIADNFNAECGTSIDLDDPDFFNGISDSVAVINDFSLRLPC